MLRERVREKERERKRNVIDSRNRRDYSNLPTSFWFYFRVMSYLSAPFALLRNTFVDFTSISFALKRPIVITDTSFGLISVDNKRFVNIYC